MNRNVLEFSTQWVIQIDDNDQDITGKVTTGAIILSFWI